MGTLSQITKITPSQWTTLKGGGTVSGVTLDNDALYLIDPTISTSSSKTYLLGVPSSTSLETVNTNSSCYMSSGKLYSSGREVATVNTQTATNAPGYNIGDYIMVLDSTNTSVISPSAVSSGNKYKNIVSGIKYYTGTNAEVFGLVFGQGYATDASYSETTSLTGTWIKCGRICGVRPSNTSLTETYVLCQRIA